MKLFKRSKKKTNWKYILIVVIVAVVVGGVLVWQFCLKDKPEESEELSHSSCLSSTEEVQYQVYENKEGPSNAKIFIKDKDTGRIVFEFQVENIRPNYPYEAHKCGIYLIREFNYDYKIGKSLLDFKMEVWRYRYDGSGEKLIKSSTFKVDSNEKYLAFREDLGDDLLVDDLKTKENLFVLPFEDMCEKYSYLPGYMEWIDWTEDGRYLWGEIGALYITIAFFRVDATNWNLEIFDAPEGVLGGSVFNTENGYVTRYPGYTWPVDEDGRKQIEQEWREQGKISSLYLYDLFSKDDILLATASEPLWNFKAKWISDTELEYELSSGEKEVYVIEEETTEWKTYRNEKYGLEFRYPTTWKIHEDTSFPFLQFQQVDGENVVAIAGGITIISKEASSPYVKMLTSDSRCPDAAGSRNLSSPSQWEEYVYCLTGDEIEISAGTWKGAVECPMLAGYGLEKMDPPFRPNEFWIDTKNFFFVAHFNFFQAEFFEIFLKGFSFFTPSS